MNIVEFITGGNATFTLTSTSIELVKNISYRIRPAKIPHHYFVSYLYGQNNTTDYTYLGMFSTNDYNFRLTAKSRVTSEADSVKLFTQFLDVLAHRREWPTTLHFTPSGRCGRCGRMLTTPESIERGFGPECFNR